MVVLVAKYMFFWWRMNLKTTKNLYFHDLHMKSKMAAISFTFLCFEIWKNTYILKSYHCIDSIFLQYLHNMHTQMYAKFQAILTICDVGRENIPLVAERGAEKIMIIHRAVID